MYGLNIQHSCIYMYMCMSISIPLFYYHKTEMAKSPKKLIFKMLVLLLYKNLKLLGH